MTRERKIEILKDLLVQLSDSANILCTCEADERCEVVEECIKSLEQQPDDDCISRQAVKDIFPKWKFISYEAFLSASAEIDNLSPVTPTRKVGKWIRVDHTKVKCSNCDITHLIAQYPHGVIDYCPNCGSYNQSIIENEKC